MSQEELADKLDVSRQAVSKWESAMATPSLDKILQLSELFGVTTDYLLKDEIDTEPSVDEAEISAIKRISLEEANNYLALRKQSSWRIAIATLLCILSPITLLILQAAATNSAVSDVLAGAIGIVVLFLFVLCALPLFIFSGFKNAPFEFLDKSVPFELEYGVSEIIHERIKAFRNTYAVCNVIATCLCTFSMIPLILAAFTENAFLIVIMVCVTIAIVGIGVFIFIVVGVQNASMQKLLKEGEYTLSKKRNSEIKEPIGYVYWGIAVAIYLVWSFLTDKWNITWLVFAIAGVLFPIVMVICNLLVDKHDKK